MRLHPRDPHIDYAYYLKGLTNFNRGRGFLDSWVARDMAKHDAEVMQNAYNDFATLVRRFPDSQYAGDAHQRMVFLRNKMAQKEIDVAEYYIERGTWLSAANRAREVIERYQDSIWSHRALEIMISAYRNLGLDELADDAQRVLQLNKPAAVESIPEPDDDDDDNYSPPSVVSSGV